MTRGRGNGRRFPRQTAFRQLQETLSWVDLVLEVRDARLPVSSGHPRAESIFGDSPRLVILAKADLADPEATHLWISRIAKQTGTTAHDCLALDLKRPAGRGEIVERALALTATARHKRIRKGFRPRPLRALVAGMPNVGKSSLINWVTGRKVVKVADRPGITRGLQWIRLHPDLELADTAGVLPAANLAKRTWETLAILNLVSRSTEDDTQIAEVALAMIHAFYPGQLEKYYAQAAKLRAGRHEPEAQALKAEEPALADIALRFCLLLPGGRPDTTRAAKLLLKDLRSGKIGRITLDRLADAGSGSQEGPGLRARNL